MTCADAHEDIAAVKIAINDAGVRKALTSEFSQSLFSDWRHIGTLCSVGQGKTYALRYVQPGFQGTEFVVVTIGLVAKSWGSSK